MKELKWITVLPIVLGVISLIYGWTQSWDYSYDDSTEYLNSIRTIRVYVFTVGGFILILVGIIVRAIRNYIESVEVRTHQINRKMEEE